MLVPSAGSSASSGGPTPAVLPRDRLGAALGEPTLRRVLLLALFVGALYGARHLVICGLVAVAVRALVEAGVRAVSRLPTALGSPPVPRPRAVVLVTLLGTTLVGAGLWLGGGRLVAGLLRGVQEVPGLLVQAQHTVWWGRVAGYVPEVSAIVHTLTTHLTHGLAMAGAVGEVLLLALVGVVLGVLWSAQRDALAALWQPLDPASPTRTLVRWAGYAAEGAEVMVRTQLLVALTNTALTLPLLWLLGLPSLPSLAVVTFLGSLVPVVGNLAAGVLLALVAGAQDGMHGALWVTVLVAVLHKVEAYVINPRLASSRLQLPSVLVILSLLVWERLLGVAGLFVSLPALVLWQRLRAELRDGIPDLPPAPAPDGLEPHPVSLGASPPPRVPDRDALALPLVS